MSAFSRFSRSISRACSRMRRAISSRDGSASHHPAATAAYKHGTRKRSSDPARHFRPRALTKDLSDKRRTRGRGSTRRPRASAPERATACLVPAEDGRRLDEQRGVAPRRCHACCEPHREALPRCPPNPPRDLSLRDDELLPKQGDETGAAAHDVGGHPHHEPKDLDHSARCTAVSVRMAFVARTGAAARRGERRGPAPVSGLRSAYGKLTNRSRRSVALAAPPSIGVTPKISSIVRSVE